MPLRISCQYPVDGDYSMRMSTFKDWFEAQLRKHGLKQETLAARLHVDQSTVSRWKNGADLKAKYVYPLARELRVDPIELFERAAGADPAPSYGRRLSEPMVVYAAGAQPRSGSPLVGFETRGGQWFFVYVEGDCLAPRVRPGAGLLFDREGRADVDKIVCVVVNGERHVKVIKAMNGLWTLADNQGELVLPVEDVTVEGVMVGEPWYQ